MSAFDILRSFAESRNGDSKLIWDGLTYGTAREVVAYIAKLEAGWLVPQCNGAVGSAFKPGDYCTYCGGRIVKEDA